MAFTTTRINVGTTANDGTGDTLREGGQAINTIIDDITTKAAEKSNVLELDNTDVFTPDSDYEPATKKYVDDNIISGGIDEGGFYLKHTYVSGGGVPALGEFTTNVSTPNATILAINKTDATGAKFVNGLIDGMNLLMIKHIQTGNNSFHSISNIADNTDYVTLTIAGLFTSASISTFTNGDDYALALGYSTTNSGMTSFTIHDDGATTHEITDGMEITFDGQDGIVTSIQTDVNGDKILRFDITAIDGGILTDNTVGILALDGMSTPSSPTAIMASDDETFELLNWDSSNMPYISGESIAGDGSTTRFTFTPNVYANNRSTPICFLYDYADNKNLVLGKYIGLGSTPEVWVEMDNVNNNFDIVFATAPSGSKTYALTYIC